MAAVTDTPSLLQQSWSTYMSWGAGTPVSRYCRISPAAMLDWALLALGTSEDTNEDLPKLVTYVGNPGGRVSGGTGELPCQLKGGTARKSGGGKNKVCEENNGNSAISSLKKI